MSSRTLEQFLVACGWRGALRLGFRSAEQPTDDWICRSFRQPFLIVGRDPSADMVFDHWTISRKHAYLQLIGGRVFCQDLESRAGLVWDDGEREAGWLDPGRIVRFGSVEVRLWDEGPRPVGSWVVGRVHPLRGSALGEATALPGVRLESPAAEGEGMASWRMDRLMALVGCGEACKVRLPSPDASRFECCLVRTPVGLWIVDLLGRNGVRIGGHRIRCARLEDGDEARVDRFLIRPRYDTPLPAIPGGELLQVRTDLVSGGDSSDAEQAALPAPDDWLMRQAASLPMSMPAPGSTMPAPAWGMPGLPMTIPSGGAVDGQLLMRTMVGQMAMMQQMFEQFHQAMNIMFQMFGASQREQMDVIRQELEEVRQLTRELQTLQTRVGDLEKVPARPAEATSDAPAPTAPPTSAAPAACSAAAVPAGGPSAEAAEAGSSAAPAGVQADLQFELWQRISTLQNERQGRWQRIMKLVSGSGPGGGAGVPTTS